MWDWGGLDRHLKYLLKSIKKAYFPSLTTLNNFRWLFKNAFVFHLQLHSWLFFFFHFSIQMDVAYSVIYVA